MLVRTVFVGLLMGVAATVTGCDGDDEPPVGVDASVPADAGGGVTTVADARTVDAAADTAGTRDAGVDAGSDAGAAPSWAMVYAQVITPRCLPCHGQSAELGVSLGRLDMSSQALAYTNLVNVAAMGAACTAAGPRVVPGSPGSSVLYLKVSTDAPVPCGAKMPLTGSISSEEAELIEEWIMGGARQ
jgi:hypothetical protein